VSEIAVRLASPEDVFVAAVDGGVAGDVQIGPSIALPANEHVLTIRGRYVDDVLMARDLTLSAEGAP
jgi:hypothetical protein